VLLVLWLLVLLVVVALVVVLLVMSTMTMSLHSKEMGKDLATLAGNSAATLLKP